MPPNSAAAPTKPSANLQEYVIAVMLPFYLPYIGNDAVAARAAVVEASSSYRLANPASLLAVLQMLAYSSASLSCLGMAMAPELCTTIRLRLISQATALHRAYNKAAKQHEASLRLPPEEDDAPWHLADPAHPPAPAKPTEKATLTNTVPPAMPAEKAPTAKPAENAPPAKPANTAATAKPAEKAPTAPPTIAPPTIAPPATVVPAADHSAASQATTSGSQAANRISSPARAPHGGSTHQGARQDGTPPPHASTLSAAPQAASGQVRPAQTTPSRAIPDAAAAQPPAGPRPASPLQSRAEVEQASKLLAAAAAAGIIRLRIADKHGPTGGTDPPAVTTRITAPSQSQPLGAGYWQARHSS